MTGVSPAEMLMDHRSHSHLDLMPSNMSSKTDRMFSRPKILFPVSLLFVALLNSILLLNFEFFNHFSYLYKYINGS